MTGIVAIFLALVAGLMMTSRRGMTQAVVVPYLLVCIVQTIGLAAGWGVNPPSTVTQVPGNVAYFAVQLVILALTLLAADQIRMFRLRRASGRTDDTHRVRMAVGLNLALSAVAVAVFFLFRPVFDPGSVAHHTGTGNPPVGGTVGILLLPLTIVVLGGVNLIAKRRQPTPAQTQLTEA
jgi:hypothetical protein